MVFPTPGGPVHTPKYCSAAVFLQNSAKRRYSFVITNLTLYCGLIANKGLERGLGGAHFIFIGLAFVHVYKVIPNAVGIREDI